MSPSLKPDSPFILQSQLHSPVLQFSYFGFSLCAWLQVGTEAEGAACTNPSLVCEFEDQYHDLYQEIKSFQGQETELLFIARLLASYPVFLEFYTQPTMGFCAPCSV